MILSEFKKKYDENLNEINNFYFAIKDLEKIFNENYDKYQEINYNTDICDYVISADIDDFLKIFENHIINKKFEEVFKTNRKKDMYKIINLFVKDKLFIIECTDNLKKVKEMLLNYDPNNIPNNFFNELNFLIKKPGLYIDSVDKTDIGYHNSMATELIDSVEQIRQLLNFNISIKNSIYDSRLNVQNFLKEDPEIQKYFDLQNTISHAIENTDLELIKELSEFLNKLQKNLSEKLTKTYNENKNKVYYNNKFNLDNIATQYLDEPSIKFLRKIFKYIKPEEFNDLLNISDAHKKNSIKILSNLNLSNQELQLIFSKNKLNFVLDSISNLYDNESYHDNENLKTIAINFFTSKIDNENKTKLLRELHNNFLKSNRTSRLEELKELSGEYSKNLYMSSRVDYYESVLEQEKMKNFNNKIDILNQIINSPNLSIIKTNLGNKILNIISKSKTLQTYKSTIDDSIKKLIPNFNFDDLIKNINEISSLFSSSKINILDRDFERKVNDVNNQINSVLEFKTLKKYINKVEPKIPEVKFQYSFGKYTFKTMDNSPSILRIGQYTNCCQSIGGAGEKAAIDSFINSHANVVLLYEKEGLENIIAQSYFHFVEETKEIIFDNVEVNNNNSKNVDINSLFKSLGEKLKSDLKLSVVKCGLEYNKLDESKFTIKYDPNASDNRKFSVLNPYSDFDPTNYLVIA